MLENDSQFIEDSQAKWGAMLTDNYWCSEPSLDPLPFDECYVDDIIYRIPLFGGMTNAIKMVLLAVIQAYEENRCFFIDESTSHLNNFDKTHYYENGFYARYFERIGLSNEDPRVQKAQQEKRILSLTWQEVWADAKYRRMYDKLTSIPSLGYEDVPGHELKAIMLRRMWRPLPAVREAACKRVSRLVGNDTYVAMSVRRGDKDTELFDFIDMENYISAAENVFQSRYNNTAQTIFVASDDCTVLSELRSKRPHWRFVSECDNSHQSGFVLTEMEKWKLSDYDSHYEKFFTELFALYGASYVFGVAYTNVAWFIYFMRGGKPVNFELLDKPPKESHIEFKTW
jgi:Alpha-(1,6)-fucosyltransferase N- and catalytic domains